MARGELPREVARRIIDTVGGSGTPPEYGFQYFTVGLDDYLQVLEGEYLADYIQQGGSCFKLVVGIYGGGKTHFLYCVRERAWRHRFVVSYVTLSPEQTPLHKLELVYRAVALNLTRPLTAAELQSGYEQGIESLVQSWYAQKRAELEHAGFSGDELAEALRSYAATIRGFESVSFARAMQGAFLALLERRDEDFDTLMQWLKGEGYVRSLHGKLGILQRIDRSTAFSMLRSLLQWVRFLGYAGLVILMDEAERVPSLSSRQRELLLHNLRELIDACAQVHFKHTLCLYAVPDETFLEGRAQIYEALRQRLATTFDVINPTGVKIDLEKAGSDAVATLEAIGHKLAAIYAVAYDTSLDSAHLSATTSEIAQAAYEHRYGEAGYKRLFVQRLVQALHLLRIRGGPVSARDVGLEST
ncbi:MAG: ATP-binding protein [Candidatus Tectimicrobiota bacterium]|nr:MAG: ATP-binding protein [Candidatus Tectomicrobia bacterium]